eukprot:2341018-Alexandrium_andersonii.AAC.1
MRLFSSSQSSRTFGPCPGMHTSASSGPGMLMKVGSAPRRFGMGRAPPGHPPGPTCQSAWNLLRSCAPPGGARACHSP